MDSRRFLSQLASVTGGTALALAALYLAVPQAQVHGKFAAGTVLLFVCISIGLFFAGASTAKSSSKMAFNNVISLSVFGKMVVSLAALFIYKSVAKPENTWFVLIFLLVYIVYTVFEVMFMTKLAKS